MTPGEPMVRAHCSFVKWVTASERAICVIIWHYEEGKAHPVARCTPICKPGRLRRSADGRAHVHELLRLDALRAGKPIADLLHSGTSRASQSPSADIRSHRSGRELRTRRHASAFERNARGCKSNARAASYSLLLTAVRALHHTPFIPDLAPAIGA